MNIISYIIPNRCTFTLFSCTWLQHILLVGLPGDYISSYILGHGYHIVILIEITLHNSMITFHCDFNVWPLLCFSLVCFMPYRTICDRIIIDHGHFDYIFPEITLFTSKERQSRFQNKFPYQNLPTYNLYFDACSHITKCLKIFPACKEPHGMKTFNSLLQYCERCC